MCEMGGPVRQMRDSGVPDPPEYRNLYGGRHSPALLRVEFTQLVFPGRKLGPNRCGCEYPVVGAKTVVGLNTL